MTVPDHTIGRLAHVLPKLQADGPSTYAFNLVRRLPEYHHTVFVEGVLGRISQEMLWSLQLQGADVIYMADTTYRDHVVPVCGQEVTPSALVEGNFSAAILYNLHGHAGLGAAVPSIQCVYGNYNPELHSDAVMAVSECALKQGYRDPHDVTSDAVIIPPGVNFRQLRDSKKKTAEFTVGLVNSGENGKYPHDLVRALLGGLPKSTALLITLPDHVPDTTHQAIKARQAAGGKLSVQKVTGTLGAHYLRHLDVLVYANAPGYTAPYARTVWEAMSIGVTVVSQECPALSATLVDKNNCLLFQSRDEAVDAVLRLQRSPRAATLIGANGQLAASKQEDTHYVNSLRHILREIGR